MKSAIFFQTVPFNGLSHFCAQATEQPHVMSHHTTAATTDQWITIFISVPIRGSWCFQQSCPLLPLPLWILGNAIPIVTSATANSKDPCLLLDKLALFSIALR